ncbi:MAG: peptidoglycan DD-metalloendopeptidase family protein [Thermoleophilaceae bacterium]|nr:peptidoglycan DD-metalloendopeptidase family protein [Thermoleophilaceae bacterium]
MSTRRVIATVPLGAADGRLLVTDSYGQGARSRRPVRLAGTASGPIEDVAPTSRFFFNGRRRPRFEFEVQDAAKVTVELVDAAQSVLRTWGVEAVPGEPHRLQWNGRLGGRAAPSGTYTFRFAATAAGALRAPGLAEPTFAFADHIFPIRGKHNLGFTRTNGFGGGRGHKGQDMFARCGTTLAAARGGRVQYAGYHSAAGYYVVIDGAATGRDYVYMHLRRPALVEAGQRVFTGQKIGEVGETGRATGCHLHFEMWSAPGWYEGGRAFDPLPALRRWDAAG